MLPLDNGRYIRWGNDEQVHRATLKIRRGNATRFDECGTDRYNAIDLLGMTVFLLFIKYTCVNNMFFYV